MTTTADAFRDRAAAAIDGLHRVLQAWFNAEGPEDPSVVLAHFSPSFTMISPLGSYVLFEQFSAGLPRARGSRAGLVMTISDVVVRYCDEHTALVTYQEHQEQGDKVTDRLSTALLLNQPGKAVPQWLHLQETWKA